ncbi:GNAT family N-acetyltransferase [Mesorhizobium sp. BAC0120]|uniref:GNAT family N-acetyltransferase n=1 Tax=Mesorhizobium sp. BAC0120 TaxID=3090670 RepID=UPI00298C6D9E|nr:GNAT family N-acetyltransferase [Mesorhizobium sp. BAC0120]MDW6021213.1 GNAT family N-acetyltransferase [Mesorhizobium sp. BAC0120]
MQAKFRAASVADLGALIDLENRSFSSDRLSPESLRRLVSSPSAAVIAATTDRALAGYAVVLFRSGSRIARLYSLAVEPDRRGLGRELLGAAEREAASRDCSVLRLEVRQDNARAIGLYERASYRRFGQKPHYYADGATALRFEKSLKLDAEIAGRAGTAVA